MDTACWISKLSNAMIDYASTLSKTRKACLSSRTVSFSDSLWKKFQMKKIKKKSTLIIISTNSWKSIEPDPSLSASWWLQSIQSNQSKIAWKLQSAEAEADQLVFTSTMSANSSSVIITPEHLSMGCSHKLEQRVQTVVLYSHWWSIIGWALLLEFQLFQ